MNAPKILARLTASSRSTFILAWIALALLSSVWAVTTPLSASPDEPSHIIKAASVVRGEFLGKPTDKSSFTDVQVPVGIAQAWLWTCYAYDPTVSASCITQPVNGLELTEATTSAGLYNPIYYAIVGLPSLVLENTRHDIFAMRMLSGLISSFFLAFVFTVLMRMIRPLVAGIAFFAAVTPMVLFLSGSINPNSLEIVTGGALAVGLLAVLLRKTGNHENAVLAVTAAAGFFLANTRGLSPLWMALIGVTVLLFVPFSRIREVLRQRNVIFALCVMAVGVGTALAWTLKTGTLGALGEFAGAGQTSPQTAFFIMLLERSADPGVIGYFGWLDTPAPGMVIFIWSALLGCIFLVGLVLARGRALMALLFSLATVLLVPPLVQAASVESSGYIWQGRYTLVAVVAAVIFAAVAIGTTPGLGVVGQKTSRRSILVVGLVLLFGQVDSLIGAIQRYAAPGAPSFVDFIVTPQWSPPGGALPWLFAGALGVGLLIVLWLSSVEREYRDSGLARDAALVR